MGILRTNTLSGIGTDGPVFDGVTRLDTFGYVVPPVGVTSDRTLAGVTTAQGSIRFNTDSQKLEFFAQDQWFEMVIDTPALAVGSNSEAGARGVWGGGYDLTPGGAYGTSYNVLDFINISSTGNAIDFGDMIDASNDTKGSCASSTRGLWAGGNKEPSTNTNRIEYITFASTGNSIDFGDLTQARRGAGGLSNATRGVFAGGRTPTNVNTMDYVTIASTGDAVDFGDLLTPSSSQYPDTCASPTRGILAAGSPETIHFLTIATLGNTQKFGDAGANLIAGGSNSIRGIYNVQQTNAMSYITIATLGNATDFGDAHVTVSVPAAVTSSTRYAYSGGYIAPAASNTIGYVTIMTQGNAVDFGDLTVARYSAYACSNAHGGL